MNFWDRGVFSGPTNSKMTAMNSPAAPDVASARSFAQWLAQGEQLLPALVKQYEMMEAQLIELESRLADKQAEIQQLARTLGKQPPQLNRRVTAQIVTHYPIDAADRPAPTQPARLPPVRPPLARAPIAPRNPPAVRTPG